MNESVSKKQTESSTHYQMTKFHIKYNVYHIYIYIYIYILMNKYLNVFARMK